MLQLKNLSPFAPAISIFPNRDGIDTLYVVVKGTFTLWPSVELAEQQLPPQRADEYWGDPDRSSLKYASELHLGKPGTDVALVGSARSLTGPVDQMLVTLAIGSRSKSLRVFGDRVWSFLGSPSSPQPFEVMPLVWERAFGGTHTHDDGSALAEERNPVGQGFAGAQSSADRVGQKLPNLEDPLQPLSSATQVVAPACFGLVAPSWLPRRSWAGTYDQSWQKRRAPYLPHDFDPRFFQCATPDLVFERPLVGGEPVLLAGLSEAPSLRLALPRCELGIAVRVAGRQEELSPQLETVLFEPEENRFTVTWRAERVCDKQVLRIDQVLIELRRAELGSADSRQA